MRRASLPLGGLKQMPPPSPLWATLPEKVEFETEMEVPDTTWTPPQLRWRRSAEAKTAAKEAAREGQGALAGAVRRVAPQHAEQ